MPGGLAVSEDGARATTLQVSLALNGALDRLAQEDPVAAKVVELHQFAGPGHEETAMALGITVYLARRKWTYARAWLRDTLGGKSSPQVDRRIGP
jgi:hypothetical protein